MSMKAGSTRQKLWDILGKPEKKFFEFDLIAKGKRIGPATGSYWFGRNEDTDGKDDREAGAEEEKEKEKEKEKEQDPRRDPRQCPKVGETVAGLKGLRSCDGGQCVNVNFTMPPKPPEGWEQACQPPTPKIKESDWKHKWYYSIYFIRHPMTQDWKWGQKREVRKTFLQTPQVLAEFDKMFEPGYYSCDSYGIRNTDIYHDWRAFFAKPDWGTASDNVCRKAGDPYERWFAYVSVDDFTLETYQEFIRQTQTNYPPNQCTEIIATAGGFKAACDKDPNIPPELQSETSAMRLCDEEGNPVVIEQHGRGWRYDNGRCIVTVNDGGIVTGVQPA